MLFYKASAFSLFNKTKTGPHRLPSCVVPLHRAPGWAFGAVINPVMPGPDKVGLRQKQFHPFSLKVPHGRNRPGSRVFAKHTQSAADCRILSVVAAFRSDSECLQCVNKAYNSPYVFFGVVFAGATLA